MGAPSSPELVLIRKAGSGSYGSVYTSRSPTDRKHSPIAVKRNIIDHPTTWMGSIRELDILTSLKDGHPNVINLLGVMDRVAFSNSPTSPRGGAFKDDRIHFVFEHAPYDGHTFIHDLNPGYDLIKVAIRDLLLGMEFVHGRGIIHRDIKPANTLIVQNEHHIMLKVCDFGSAKPITYQGTQTPRTVTNWYRAPEIAFDDPHYTEKIDVWAVGVTIFELVGKKALFRGVKGHDEWLPQLIIEYVPSCPPKTKLGKIFPHFKGKFPTVSRNRVRWVDRLCMNPEKIEAFNRAPGGGNYEQLNDILTGMLMLDPTQRWTMAQVLDHPFFDSERDYINSVRIKYPPISPQLPMIIIQPGSVRGWGIQIAFAMYNNRTSFEWYTDRVLFRSIEVFDRYLVIENPAVIQQLTQFQIEIRYLVCLYAAIKYRATMFPPISYQTLVSEPYKTEEALDEAGRFEDHLLRDLLDYRFYVPSLYEMADYLGDRLTDADIRTMLIQHGTIESVNGVNVLHLYRYYQQHKDKVTV